MEWERLSNDLLEVELEARQRLMSRLASEQVEILEILDSRQVATADGCKSLSEWTAARLDVGLDTARGLVRTMRRTGDRPDLRDELAAGVSFDRVAALSKIPDNVGLLEHLDIGGVRHEAALYARISATTEYRTGMDRFLVLQPSLDESWWKLWGGLDGVSGAIVDKVLTDKADEYPLFPDGTRGDTAWRKATALVDLTLGDDPPPAQVTVFIDADKAVATNAETGATLATGPRIGPRALDAILCDAVTEVTLTTADGRLMEYGTRVRTIPPALRRAVLHRDHGMCTADGCNTTSRLQIHHINHRAHDGPTNPDNLTTLCWYHHQVIIHQRRYQLYHHPDHGRIRFKPPDTGPDPP